MKDFLLNIWNSQRNATELISLGSRHDFLRKAYDELERNLDACEKKRNQLIDLSTSLAVEYRAAIGNPTDMGEIPVSIQEAHALRGAHTGWKFSDDGLFGRAYSDRAERKQAAHLKQLERAGLAGFEGWTQQ